MSFIHIFIELYNCLRHVLLLNLQSQPTRQYTINTRLYFLPAVILVKNGLGTRLKVLTWAGHSLCHCPPYIPSP